MYEYLNAWLKVIEAISQFHKSGNLHNDTNPDNILFDKKGNRAELIDFGHSLLITDIATNQRLAEFKENLIHYFMRDFRKCFKKLLPLFEEDNSNIVEFKKFLTDVFDCFKIDRDKRVDFNLEALTKEHDRAVDAASKLLNGKMNELLKAGVKRVEAKDEKDDRQYRPG